MNLACTDKWSLHRTSSFFRAVLWVTTLPMLWISLNQWWLHTSHLAQICCLGVWWRKMEKEHKWTLFCSTHRLALFCWGLAMDWALLLYCCCTNNIDQSTFLQTWQGPTGTNLRQHYAIINGVNLVWLHVNWEAWLQFRKLRRFGRASAPPLPNPSYTRPWGTISMTTMLMHD